MPNERPQTLKFFDNFREMVLNTPWLADGTKLRDVESSLVLSSTAPPPPPKTKAAALTSTAFIKRV